MFDINNIRELIANGYKVSVHSDYVDIESDNPEQLWTALDVDDTSEIEVNNEDGEYQGGAVITKDMGAIDLMCTHESSTGTVDAILRRTSVIKPLQWIVDGDWKISDPYFTATSLRFCYTVGGKRGNYKVTVGDMVNNTNELRSENFNNLQQAILWAEKHHTVNMKGYVYGI